MSGPQEQAEGIPGCGPASGRRAWAVVYLFALAVVLSAVSLFWVNHEVHATEAAVQQQAQHQEQQRLAAQRRQQKEQAAAQLKQSVGICEAMIGLDDARIGAEFATSAHTGIPLGKSYGYRLSRHIHDVVEATHCSALLAGKLPAGGG